jgi:hypothetical protein
LADAIARNAADGLPLTADDQRAIAAALDVEVARIDDAARVRQRRAALRIAA